MPSINELLKDTKHQLKTLRAMAFKSAYKALGNTANDQAVIHQFHQLYYNSAIFKETWTKTSWLGVSVLKCPLDLWVYQELLFELKPDRIVECGTAAGGGTLFFASMCDLVGRGKVISIDVEARERPVHPRITYLTGSSTSADIVRQVKEWLEGDKNILVVLDSDHSKTHVLEELRTYQGLVPKGGYMVVEDSNINGHPVYPEFGPGPMEAIDAFLSENAHFKIDTQREKFLLTFNPRGYLRRIS